MFSIVLSSQRSERFARLEDWTSLSDAYDGMSP